MASTRDLRRRIRSIKNTSQITKAMQMVSATKMRKAQNQALSGRPYNQTLSTVLSLASNLTEYSNPLLDAKEPGNIGVLGLSSDKGLCGSLNTNLIRTVYTQEIFKSQVVFYTIGRKLRDYIVRTDKVLEADFENKDKVNFNEAVKIRKYLVASFLEGKISEVYLLYPNFISTLKQEAKLIRLLPINFSELKKYWETLPKGQANQEDQLGSNGDSEFLYEPSIESVLDFCLVHLLDTQIYQAMLETKASEHSARMMAMQNATDNAKELVDDLTLTYNQARQDAITKELLEIASAGAAME